MSKRRERNSRRGHPKFKIVQNTLYFVIGMAVAVLLIYGIGALKNDLDNKIAQEPSPEGIHGALNNNSTSIGTTDPAGSEKEELPADPGDSTEKQTLDVSPPEPDALTSYQYLLENGTVSELALECKSITQGIAGLTLPGKVLALNRRIELSERIQELTDDESFVGDAITNRLTSRLVLNTLNIEHQFSEDNLHANLIDDATAYKNHTNQSVRQTANNVLCFASIQKYYKEPNDDNRILMTNQFEESAPIVSDKLAACEALVQTANSLPTLGFRDEFESILLVLANSYKDSTTPIVEELGWSLFDRILTDELAESKVNWQTLSSTDSMVNLIRQTTDNVAKSNNSTIASYQRCCSAIEKLNRIDEPELVTQLLDQLENSIDTLRPGEQEAARTLFSKSKARQKMLGKKFDIDGKCIDESLLEVQENSATVILIVDGDSEFGPANFRFTELQYLRENGVRFVVYNSNEAARDKFVGLISDFHGISYLSMPDAKQYLQFCTEQNEPYIVIVDPDQNVACIDVDPDRIRIEVMKLIDEESK